jgi:hypothetical protein
LISRPGIVAVVALLSLAGCSTASESADTTLLPTTTSKGDADSTTSTTGAVNTTTTTAATTTTEPEAAVVPTGILVASESGIVLIDGANATTLLDEPASVAVDDLMGGVVYQGPRANGGYGEPEDTIVWWLPAGAETPQSLLVPTGDQRLRLVAVERIDGSPTVVYIRSENPGDFENAEDTLRLYDFDTAVVTEIRTVGGWESGSGQITFGGGIFASNWFGEAYSGFDFFDAEGNGVEVGGNPYPSGVICFDGTIDPGGGRCYDNVAISPDGSLLAYTRLIADDDGIVTQRDLVVVSTTDGTELHRMPLRTEEPFSIASLEIRDDLVLVNRFAFLMDDPEPAVVVDLGTGTVGSLDVPGIARFSVSSPSN